MNKKVIGKFVLNLVKHLSERILIDKNNSMMNTCFDYVSMRAINVFEKLEEI